MSGTSSIRAHRRQVFFAAGRLSCPAAGAAPARVSPPFGRITGSASAMGRFLLVRPSGQVRPDGVQDIPQALTVVGRNTLKRLFHELIAQLAERADKRTGLVGQIKPPRATTIRLGPSSDHARIFPPVEPTAPGKSHPF